MRKEVEITFWAIALGGMIILQIVTAHTYFDIVRGFALPAAAWSLHKAIRRRA